ncbi:DUF3143 domain-containing protein [Pseudanabaena sp. PCC 6802]|uniref:DUF3143 domain-containing protein n=1 Tax=Pseudanabaena sp. PCC 6802 TaxID=118173 RepID=UPI000347E5D4|nr:DUF3143 domain-containing protein [Pseudanabaena sp. PCC 6802]
MRLPSPDTPLYNHPLPLIESWLQTQGCTQDKANASSWYVRRNGWEAEIWMDIEEIRVRYINAIAGNKDIQRVFPYSLSRQDIEDAIFTGP